MNLPPRSLEARPDDAEPSIVPKAFLALGAGAAGAAAGAALTVFILKPTGFYIPMIPGLAAGYAISRLCQCNSTLVSIVGAVCAFFGGLFAEAFCYTGHPGVLHYVSHFYENGLLTDWIFRALNIGIGFYTSRGAGESLPVTIGGSSCPHCGEGNLPSTKYCAHCGQPTD